MKEYHPVSCQLVDLIEHNATLGQPVKLVFLNEQGQKIHLEDSIKTWYTHQSVEYLKLKSYSRDIRLDAILLFNDKPFPGIC